MHIFTLKTKFGARIIITSFISLVLYFAGKNILIYTNGVLFCFINFSVALEDSLEFSRPIFSF